MTPSVHSAALISHHFSAVVETGPGFDCSAASLAELLASAAARAGLQPVGQAGVDFQHGGASAAVLLAESHVAAHYWPELDRLTVDIHVCDFRRDNLERARRLARLVEAAVAATPATWRCESVAG
jgi:S-adenosylmethionine/arginine decarboxylase-like enzyme